MKDLEFNRRYIEYLNTRDLTKREFKTIAQQQRDIAEYFYTKGAEDMKRISEKPQAKKCNAQYPMTEDEAASLFQ